MRKFNLVLVLAVAVSFLFALNSDSLAQSACDGESGAAYGLCNAYCDAMDCDGAPEASQEACDKVEANYLKITGMPVPCEQVSECSSGADCPDGQLCAIDIQTGIGTCVCRGGC